MFGIDNLKKAAKLAVKFATQIEESAEGGFKTSDLFSFIDEVAAIPELISNKKAIVDEFKDLDANERRELVSYIESELTLKNKKTEEVVESALEFILSLLSLLEKLGVVGNKDQQTQQENSNIPQ